MAELSSTRIAFVRRRLARAAAALAVGAAVLPLAAFGVLSLVGAGAALVASVAGALHPALGAALVLALVSFVAARDLVGAEGTLQCDDDSLVVTRGRSVRRVPRALVQGGILAPGRDRVAVELELAGGDRITARVPDFARGRALLSALHVDVANQRCRVELADRSAALVITTFVPVVLAGLACTPFAWTLPPSMHGALFVGLYAVAAGLMKAVMALPEVTIGTDGIAFRRGLREEFVPFADLETVRHSAYGLRIVYRDGRTRLLRSLTGVSPARFEALMLRIREAKAARAAAPRQALAQLDRGSRTLAEWRAALAALARRGLDYRGAGLSSEDLEAELGSPDVTAERRIGAAVALAASKNPEAPERIRIAAAQCASERLRIALEKVSRGEEDDEAVAEALGEPEARRRA